MTADPSLFHKNCPEDEKHAPKLHADSHISGSDLIPDATVTSRGLMSAAQAQALEDAASGTGNINISVLTEIDAIADADTFLVDDGGSGKNRKSTFSKLWIWVLSKLSAVATSGSYNDLSNKPDLGSLHTHTNSAVLADLSDSGGKLAYKGSVVDENTGGGSLDINGSTDVGESLADDDGIIIYNTSVTANRKSAVSRIWTYVTGKIQGLSGKATPIGADVLTIQDSEDSNALKSLTLTNMFSQITINNLYDVTIDSVTDKELLVYDNASGEWINMTAAEAGITGSSWNGDLSDMDIDSVSEYGYPLSDNELLVVADSVTGDITSLLVSRVWDYIAYKIQNTSAKTTPVGEDLLMIQDSADSNDLKELTITNLFKTPTMTYTSDTADFSTANHTYVFGSKVYAQTRGEIVDSTASSELGAFYISLMVSGTLTDVFTFYSNGVFFTDGTVAAGGFQITGETAFTDVATGTSNNDTLITLGYFNDNIPSAYNGDITTLDIDSGTDIGADLTDADLIIVDGGAGGTNRKSTISRIWTYVVGKIQALSAKTTPTGLDILTIQDAADSNNLKELTINNLMQNQNIDFISGHIETAANKTYILDQSARYAYTIKNIYIQDTSGTCTAKIQIDGSDITGISSVSVSSSENNATATGNNTVDIGDTVGFVISSNSSALDVRFTIEIERTLS